MFYFLKAFKIVLAGWKRGTLILYFVNVILEIYYVNFLQCIQKNILRNIPTNILHTPVSIFTSKNLHIPVKPKKMHLKNKIKMESRRGVFFTTKGENIVANNSCVRNNIFNT